MEEEATEAPQLADLERARQASQDGPPAIPGYRLESTLGRGSFGTVWSAVQLQTEQRVAIKILNAHSGQGLEELERELSRLRTVAEHPYIVGLIDANLRHQPAYLVTPLLSRGSLADYANPSVAEISKWFEQLVEALRFVHARGLIHQDLKPANVLLDGQAAVRLVDFGQGLGTFWYMAPEQAAGGAPEVAWDVYGLGATIYRLLTGHLPRCHRDSHQELSSTSELQARLQLYQQLLKEPLLPVRQLNPRVDRELAAVVERCLALDPGARYRDLADLADDLARRSGLATTEAAWLRLVGTGTLFGALVVLAGWLASLRAPAWVMLAGLAAIGLVMARRFGLLKFLANIQQTRDWRCLGFFICSATVLCVYLAFLHYYYRDYVPAGSDGIYLAADYFVSGFACSLVMLALESGYDPSLSFTRQRLTTLSLLVLLAAMLLLSSSA
ncbi:MAG: serine/threonine-protein kinase [Vulcanimicrobiota bacterium]